MTDHDLVERARHGDEGAFEALVSRHHAAALRAALAALGSAADADDVAQEAWIAAHARLQDFRGASSFRTWLLSIVWNRAIDRRRQAGRWLKRLVRLDAGWDEPEGDFRTEPDRALAARSEPAARWSPEQAALDGELSHGIRRLVRALPPKLRDPLLLVGSGDYTYEEVAAMLRAPVGTIKWRVSEARRQLRAKLQRMGY